MWLFIHAGIKSKPYQYMLVTGKVVGKSTGQNNNKTQQSVYGVHISDVVHGYIR